MGHGKEFEDALCEALESWVRGQGYVWLRRQTQSMRRGQFSMGQEVDILVDSPSDEFYTCFEAKTRNAEDRLGFYFSSDLNIEQIEKGIEYAEQAGRKYVVAVEVRNYEKSDFSKTAWLVPPELFVLSHERGDVKVSWEQVDQYGYCIGHDREYVVTHEAIDSVLLDTDRLESMME